MSKKQKIAIAALPVLALMMYCVFQVLAQLFGRTLAWYAGFWVYWPLWCIGYSIWMLGLGSFRDLFHSRKLDVYSFSLLILPIIFSLIGKLFFSRYDIVNFWEKIVLVLMAFANGTLEDVLWRGVYIRLFPDDKFWGLVWPTMWFSLWHYAPGSMRASPYVLMGGALVFGGCLAWLAMKTDSIRWSAVCHTLAGLITVI